MNPNDTTRGIFTASLTPMNQDLGIDHQALAAHCRRLLGGGCSGIVILGTTGEANSMTVAERMDLLDGLTENGIRPEDVIVGTGCCAVSDTVALNRHALSLGMTRVLILPPFYYKHVSDDGLYAYFDRVIRKTGDARLRIFLYNFPQMTGIPFSLSLIERFLDAYPDTIVGVKDSSGSWENMKAMVKAFPKFRVFAGTERLLLELLRAGGAGCISATMNITYRIAAQIIGKWQEEDVIPLQEQLIAVRKALESHAFIPGLKSLMAEWTHNTAWRHMRPPHRPLSPEDVHGLSMKLKALGFEPPAD